MVIFSLLKHFVNKKTINTMTTVFQYSFNIFAREKNMIYRFLLQLAILPLYSSLYIYTQYADMLTIL